MQDETEEQEQEKPSGPIPINWDDIDQLEDDSPEEDIDPLADAYEAVPPTKPGTYNFLFAVGEKGITQGEFTSRRDGSKVKYFNIPLVLTAKSEDPEVDGLNVYENLSTIVGGKRKTSTLLTVLGKMGIPIPNKATPATQIKLLKAFIDTEPVRALTTDWELSYKDSEDKLNPKTGRKETKDVYKMVKKGFKDFPSDKTTKSGKKELFKLQKRDGSEVEARPRSIIVDWAPGTAKAGTAAKAATPPKTLTSASSASVADLEKELD